MNYLHCHCNALFLALLSGFLVVVCSWTPTYQQTAATFHRRDTSSDCPTALSSSRREWIATAASVTFPSMLSLLLDPSRVNAVDAIATTEPATATATPLAMKTFVDPQGLFSLRVPSTFFTLRRTVKGDLPDAKGKGRRGSSIFTGGNMAKAEVVAVERYPVNVLLEENGISATGDLSTFPSIGEPKAVASLLVLRREKDTQNQGIKSLDNAVVSPDGKELTFRLRTEIEVQKPELLLEQYGVSQLFRITVAKATLNSDDGNLFAIFASALEQDFNNGIDGPALEDVVNSFSVTKQDIL